MRVVARQRGSAVTGFALALALLGTACAGVEAEERTAVAALYPLAFAAERIAGPGWRVIDLTPPGAEAHDLELSLEDRSTLGRADLQFVLDPEFQPQVWRSIGDSGGVIHVISDEPLADPHLWLSPRTYLRRMVEPVLDAFVGYLGDDRDEPYRRRYRDLERDLRALTGRYDRVLASCRHDTLIVSHEAFGYLAADHKLRQFGLAGLSPEAEPTHDRIVEAQRLLADGRAGAVFFEAGEDAERIARSVARDAGVPALPLSTLESQPEEGDYLSVMEDNLESLREGLGCE
ncbi:MAG: metal ABC transporter substrate-binding protein [Actinomycetota bacterium]